VNGLHRVCLVGVEALDAARREAGPDPRVQPGRVGAEFRGLRRDVAVMDHAPGERGFLEQAGKDGLRAGGGVGSHRLLHKQNR
jgi:hypothetical protein